MTDGKDKKTGVRTPLKQCEHHGDHSHRATTRMPLSSASRKQRQRASAKGGSTGIIQKDTAEVSASRATGAQPRAARTGHLGNSEGA